MQAKAETPKRRRNRTLIVGDSGKLWDLRAGHTDLLLVDFLNITCWPTRSEVLPGEVHAKVDFLAKSGSHVSLIAETHASGQVEQLMGSTLLRQKLTTFSAPAEESTKCDKGSFGGAATVVHTFMNTSPLAG